jgi:hypothetical protein
MDAEMTGIDVRCHLAEAVRFELTNVLRRCRFSRPVHSTALPRFRCFDDNRRLPLLVAVDLTVALRQLALLCRAGARIGAFDRSATHSSGCGF